MSILNSKEQQEFLKKFKILEDFIGTDDRTGKRAPLRELALDREKRWQDKLEQKSSLFPVFNVSLTINWDFEKLAKPRIDRFKKLYPEITSLQELKNRLNEEGPKLFIKKYMDIEADPKNPDKNPKFALLKTLIDGFLSYQKKFGFINEYEALRHWADNLNLKEYKQDYIGCRKGVGLGTIQNIKLNMGYNVVKPDRHVRNVLKTFFDVDIEFYQHDELARELDFTPLYFDKVLFEYGRNKGLIK